jgi:hypothetical protein
MPEKQQPDPLLTYEDLSEIKTIRDLYGDIVADRIKDQIISEKQQPDPMPEKQQPDRPVGSLGLAELSPHEIHADPRRFQFKIIHNAKSGSSGSLKGIRQWNHDLAGLLLVWHDPNDNKTYVVNGHNRLDLAQKLEVDRIAVRYIDATDHIKARLIGAIANLAESKGSPLDIATLIRDMKLSRDDLDNLGVKVTDTLADKGIALANLMDCYFEKYLIGDISENIAVAMGRLDHDLQSSFFELVSKEKRSLSVSVLDEIVAMVKESVSQQSFEFSLFGENSVTVNLATYKAEINAYILKKLKRDKYLFSLVSKGNNATDLSKGNNSIDTLTSSQIADSARIAIDLFNQFKNVSGSLSGKINDAAIALHNGDNPSQIKQNIYDWVLSELSQVNILSLAI